MGKRTDSRCRRIIVFFAAAFFLASLSAGTAAAAAGGETVPVTTPEWAERWRDDLRFLAWKFPEVYPEPYGLMAREDFDAGVGRLIDEVPDLSHHGIVLELARLIAGLNDGHSRVTLPLLPTAGFFLGHTGTPPPRVPGLVFHDLPVRLYRYSDGVFIRKIGTANRSVAGWKVIGIGDRTIEEVMDAVSGIVHRDNPMQLEANLPDDLVILEVLQAAGAADGTGGVEFVLESPAGLRSTVSLEPVGGEDRVHWVDAREAGNGEPLYLRNRDRNFWFEYLEKQRTVYWQYNEVRDGDEETIEQFAGRLFGFIDRHPVDRLIIDLRRNRGGDNTLQKPLLHGLIRCDKLRSPGTLFAVIGRDTFSAAMMFALDLEKHTPVIFVGEPTGGKPNHFGDSRKIVLPKTGMTVRLSTLYWQYSDPRDLRRWITPHLPAALTSRDYAAGRDPALAAILDPAGPSGTDRNPGNAGLAGRWRGRALIFFDKYDVTLAFRQEDGRWTGSMGLEGEEVSLEGITFERGEVGFEVPLPEATLVLHGTVRGDRIYGETRAGGPGFPFVFSRDPSTAR